MDVQQRIATFAQLGKQLLEGTDALDAAIASAAAHNPWFSPAHTREAIQAIARKYLDADKLENWLAAYDLPNNMTESTIGVVAAGNIPLVGFHDLLCVLITGNNCQLKLSEKDSILFPAVLEMLVAIEPAFRERIQLKQKLGGFDAIICTGSNNTARYFEHYFGRYPHIIRRNRNAVAILDGTETDEELVQLGADVFTHFGLGCRNVSKLFLPQDFDLLRLRSAWDAPYGDVMLHHKYKHNLDYQRTVYLMTQVPLTDIDFINIVEQEGLESPIACLYYERYTDPAAVRAKLEADRDKVQCVAGYGYLPFGTTQQPELWDYADGVDTIDFIVHLQHGNEHGQLPGV